MNYIGADIGKRNCVVCVMDSNGSIIKETNYNNTMEQAESFASSIKRKHYKTFLYTLANKMCTIIWHMLTYKKLYYERKIGLYDTKLKRIQH